MAIARFLLYLPLEMHVRRPWVFAWLSTQAETPRSGCVAFKPQSKGGDLRPRIFVLIQPLRLSAYAYKYVPTTKLLHFRNASAMIVFYLQDSLARVLEGLPIGCFDFAWMDGSYHSAVVSQGTNETQPSSTPFGRK